LFVLIVGQDEAADGRIDHHDAHRQELDHCPQPGLTALQFLIGARPFAFNSGNAPDRSHERGRKHHDEQYPRDQEEVLGVVTPCMSGQHHYPGDVAAECRYADQQCYGADLLVQPQPVAARRHLYRWHIKVRSNW